MTIQGKRLRLRAIERSDIPTFYEYNQRAVRCYEKSGFKLEGRMRQAHFYDGKYHDELIMGVLREEFIETSNDK